ncbi:LuxR C-terminal-related transcriptional regulator [Streptomyces sp. NPDC001781]
MIVAAPFEEGELFVGRAAETALFARLLGELPGGPGTVVAVSGEPGAGKTRLVSEVLRLARAAGLPGLHAPAPRVAAVPFQVFRDALVPVPGRAVPACTATCGRPGHGGPGAVCPHSGYWHDAVTRRAAGGVLVLDDAHRLDSCSLGVLLRLVRAPGPEPMLLVVAHRPRQSAPALREALEHGTRSGVVTRVDCGPLGADAVARLVEYSARSGRSPGADGARGTGGANGRQDDFLVRLRQAGEGNPHYVRLLLAADWDPEQWPDSPGRDVGALLREASATVAELDALSPSAALAARTAAVLGEPFRLDDVAWVSGLGTEATLDAVAENVRADLMRPAGPGGRMAFRHPVDGHVAHAASDLAFRLRAHRRALRLIAARGESVHEQARHAEQLAGTDPVAARILYESAVLKTSTAPETAVRRLRLTLDALPPSEAPAGAALPEEGRGDQRPADEGSAPPVGDDTVVTRTEVEFAHCRALIAAGRLTEARDAAHHLLAGRDTLSPTQLLRAHGLCAEAERLLCRYEEAEAIAAAGVALLPRPFPSALSAPGAELVLRYGLVHALRGSHDQVRPLLREASGSLGAAPPDVRVALRVLIAFCEAFSGDPAEAAREVTACARLVDALPDGMAGHTPDVLALMGCAELYLERFVDARRHLSRGLHAATGGAQKHIRAHQLLGLTMTDQWGGRLDGALRKADEAERLARRIGAPDVANLATAMRSTTLVWARGRRHAAEAVASAARAVDTVTLGRGWWATSAISLLAHAQMLGGDPVGCARTLLDGGGGERLPEVQPTFRPSLLALLADAALAGGDAARAERVLADAETEAARRNLPLQWACVRRARAQVCAAVGADAEAVTLFEQAAEDFRGAGLPLQHAWTLVAAARTVDAVRGRDAATALLDTAEAAGRSFGAILVTDEAERVRRSLPRGPGGSARPSDPLSSREREVAELAASGLRSRQIAERLFLSTRTVDSHLARVYRKLNVSSRLGLAGALHAAYEGSS